jgi:hypothetical protein
VKATVIRDEHQLVMRGPVQCIAIPRSELTTGRTMADRYSELVGATVTVTDLLDLLDLGHGSVMP